MTSEHLVPTASIELAGKTYTLRLDINALSDFEVMTGKSVLRGGLSDIANLELADVRALLWSMMYQDDETLTVRDVGRMISINNIAPLTETIATLIRDTMPEANEEATEDSDPLAQTSLLPESGGLDIGLQQSSTSE
jgi:predicted MarR family transcription regulator